MKCEEKFKDIVIEEVDEGSLLEDVPVRLSKQDMVNPDSVDLRRITNDAVKADNDAKAAIAKEQSEAAFREAHKNDYDQFIGIVKKLFHNNKMLLSEAHDLFVPDSGMAESVAAEILRATMRVLYRWYNDGDKFFEGYGLDTAGSSANYLIDKDINCLDEVLQSAEMYTLDNEYEDAMSDLMSEVVEKLANNPDMWVEINTEDSREHPNGYIQEHEPMYELEITLDDDDIDLYSAISYVRDIVTDIPEAKHANVVGYNGGIYVSDLPIQAYEYLEELVNRDDFWDDLKEEEDY